jgi:hypothetical protein
MYAPIISIYHTMKNEKTCCRWQADGKMDNVFDRASVGLIRTVIIQPLFYLTNIVYPLPPLFRRACSGRMTELHEYYKVDDRR